MSISAGVPMGTMTAADIYNRKGRHPVPTTPEKTNPTRPADASASQQVAAGTGPFPWALVSVLGAVGILVALKFASEG